MTDRSHRSRSVLLLALASVVVLTEARAVETSGSARINRSRSERNEGVTDVLDERYTARLSQNVTPYLGFDFGFRYASLHAEPEFRPEFRRTESTPDVVVRYARPRVSFLAAYREREVRATGANQDLDSHAFDARLSVRPDSGPDYVLSYQDQENTFVSLFGRDTTNRRASFLVLEQRRYWQGTYELSRSIIENPDTGLRIDQDRHQLNVQADRDWLDDRLGLSADLLFSRTDQEQEVRSGSFFERPVRPRQGLFAVDPTPEFDELDPAPGLIDGDDTDPATALSDIGAANTFRNFGVDLGFRRPITTFEIQVDRSSAPDLVWEVWRSPDNLNWTRVGGVSVSWDEALLRYTVSIPRTEERYFKVVNVTPNALPDVNVTELRTFERVQDLIRGDTTSDTVRFDGVLRWSPDERVRSRFALGYYTDQDLVPGLTTRELDTFSYDASVSVDLNDATRIEGDYGFVDYEESGVANGLDRSETDLGAGLVWSPRETVEGRVDIARREETDNGDLLRRTDTARMRAGLQVLRTVRLDSEILFSDADDPFAGFTLRTILFRETISMQVTRGWSVNASIAMYDFDSSGSIALSRRTTGALGTTWSPDRRILLNSTVAYRDDDAGRSIDQRHTLGWTPGDRVSVSVSWYDFSDESGFGTDGASANLNYRILRRMRVFGSWNRSRSTTAIDRIEIDTLSAGLFLTL